MATLYQRDWHYMFDFTGSRVKESINRQKPFIMVKYELASTYDNITSTSHRTHSLSAYSYEQLKRDLLARLLEKQYTNVTIIHINTHNENGKG